MKKIVIAASLVAAVALGAFAKGKFTTQNTAWYLDGSSVCRKITFATGNPIQGVQGADPQASIAKAAGGVSLLYTESTCSTAAEFNP